MKSQGQNFNEVASNRGPASSPTDRREMKRTAHPLLHIRAIQLYAVLNEILKG